MSAVSVLELSKYAFLMAPGEDPKTDRDERRDFALELLGKLPIVDTIKRGKTVLEERLIGTFAGELEERSQEDVSVMITIQGLLQDLLSDDENSPSTTFDPAGKLTITHRQTLLK